MMKKSTNITALSTLAVFVGIGASIYIGFEKAPEGQQNLSSSPGKLAALLKNPSLMQPLPEMPTEAPPGIPVQSEVFVPKDALMIRATDPIITGPRTAKPPSASKDS
ncbi:hypothetical protein M8994_05150 [Brucella sp. 21LCYQ03]|nr:hypothetical protein [Brucella sp. 21LCYQ03]